MNKRRLPACYYNPVTLISSAFSLIVFLTICFLMLWELLSDDKNPYMGVITFLLLPAILCCGLFLIFFGAWRQHRREEAGTAKIFRYPILDLNDPKQWRAFALIGSGTLLFLLFSCFGMYKAYEYTDSDAFCGTMCHELMRPEYTAYGVSPHARVGCVKCHIGPGAGWFVKSKLSGAYQVYATLANRYPRPIPTPIENLRPAQDTCEQCHWPRHFFSEKHVTYSYTRNEEKNTPWFLHLMLKTGGGNPETGITTGIHWSMNIANRITYAPMDDKRQVIPWIKVRSLTGVETVYRDTESKFTTQEIDRATKRTMDCIDCHNRPSHWYLPAKQTVDHALSSRRISRNLPAVKEIAVKILETPYPSTPAAVREIAERLRSHYSSGSASLPAIRTQEIEQAVVELQNIYQRNYFPEMAVTWRKFPHHIGHMYSLGCFRCHDERHRSSDGRVLGKDCNLCHTILSQQEEGSEARTALQGVVFQHPEDIGDAWKENPCSECHQEN